MVKVSDDDLMIEKKNNRLTYSTCSAVRVLYTVHQMYCVQYKYCRTSNRSSYFSFHHQSLLPSTITTLYLDLFRNENID